MSTFSQKPYLIRALWEWCNDQGHTPQIMVKIDGNTNVPQGYDDDGQIVLDIGLEATQGLEMNNEWISFQARFGVNAHQIHVPVGQVIAIFAAETGQGMSFEIEPMVVSEPVEKEVDTGDKKDESPNKTGKISPLKIIK